MQASANDIIQDAMVEARIIHPGESISSGKLSSAFRRLNGLLESWATDTLMVRVQVEENFTLTASKSSYTYGDKGDFDSDYPVFIRDSAFIRSGGFDYSCTKKGMEYYRSIRDKNTPGIPYHFVVNYTYPLATVYLFPVPNSTDDIHFSVEKEFVSFPDKTTSVNLPTAYWRALMLNLSIELSSSYGKKVMDSLVIRAFDAIDTVKILNNKRRKSTISSGLGKMMGTSTRSILTGPFDE